MAEEESHPATTLHTTPLHTTHTALYRSSMLSSPSMVGQWEVDGSVVENDVCLMNIFHICSRLMDACPLHTLYTLFSPFCLRTCMPM